MKKAWMGMGLILALTLLARPAHARRLAAHTDLVDIGGAVPEGVLLTEAREGASEHYLLTWFVEQSPVRTREISPAAFAKVHAEWHAWLRRRAATAGEAYCGQRIRVHQKRYGKEPRLTSLCLDGMPSGESERFSSWYRGVKGLLAASR